MEYHLRRMPRSRLGILKLFTGDEKFVHTSRISTASGSDWRKLGGVVSSLTRSTIEGRKLINIVGTSERKAVLELNEKLISKKMLKELLNKIGVNKIGV